MKCPNCESKLEIRTALITKKEFYFCCGCGFGVPCIPEKMDELYAWTFTDDESESESIIGLPTDVDGSMTPLIAGNIELLINERTTEELKTEASKFNGKFLLKKFKFDSVIDTIE